jgi:hypothetical protein
MPANRYTSCRLPAHVVGRHVHSVGRLRLGLGGFGAWRALAVLKNMAYALFLPCKQTLDESMQCTSRVMMKQDEIATTG